MEPLVFSMTGNPRGKGRPRATMRGAHASMYTDAKTRAYEASVKRLALAAMAGVPPLEGALSVSLRFRMPIPKSATKKAKAAMSAGETPHTSKPDIDNLQKALLDGMNGAVFRDDSQIVRAFTTKIYSDKPGVDVRVEAFGSQAVAA
jgi:Holliday junction resolvase RusA-like endonuclease